MMLDATARRFPQIQPHVDATRLVRLTQHDLRSLREVGDLVQFLARQATERGDVPARDHHQVTVVVWITIEDDVRRTTKMHDERIDDVGVHRLPGGR